MNASSIASHISYDGAVTYTPPLANASASSEWHFVDEPGPESDMGCGAFSVVALQPSPASKFLSWGTHSLSFALNGSDIYMYGLIDSTYSWSVIVDGVSTGNLRSVAFARFDCPVRFYSRTQLGVGEHSIILNINPVNRVGAMPGRFAFQYASSHISNTSYGVVAYESDIPPNTNEGPPVILWVTLPLVILAFVLAASATYFRRRQEPDTVLPRPVLAKDAHVHGRAVRLPSSDIPRALHSRAGSRQLRRDDIDV